MKHFRSILFWFGLFASLFLISPLSHGQEAASPYMVPQTIFVGDQGRLVVPLSRNYAEVEPFILETQETLPMETSELRIQRVELDRRGGTPRLLVDFIAYTPGIIPLPPLHIPSEKINANSQPGQGSSSSRTDPFTITGLQVTVASILNPSLMDLSNPAPPLAVPGTSLIVYGTIVLIMVILFLGLGGSLWGRRHFWELMERFRRWRLLRAIARFLRRLKQEASIDPKESPYFYLTTLSTEFREFLSAFTGINCRSLTAGEFLELPLDYPWASRDEAAPWGKFLKPAFLCVLFRTWDTLRFSGRGVEKEDLFKALDETSGFINALARAERELILNRQAREAEGALGPGEAYERQL